MKIIYADVEMLSQILRELGEFTGPCLVNFVVRNSAAIGPVIKILVASRAPVRGNDEYTRAQQTLCFRFSKKDEQQRPICQRIETPQGPATNYEIEDEIAFQAAVRELDEQYADVRQRYMTQQEQLSALLREEIELPLVSIKMSQCPKEAITGNRAALLARLGLLIWDVEELPLAASSGEAN